MTQEQAHRQAVRRFHILLMQCGINDNGKEGILSAYGVESSKDLDIAQLNEINNRLQHELPQNEHPESKNGIDAERRRCKVAVGKYLAAKGSIKADGWGLIEWQKIVQVAARAAKADSFFQIPLSRLRALTFEFNKQRKAIEDTREYIANNQ